MRTRTFVRNGGLTRGCSLATRSGTRPPDMVEASISPGYSRKVLGRAGKCAALFCPSKLIELALSRMWPRWTAPNRKRNGQVPAYHAADRPADFCVAGTGRNSRRIASCSTPAAVGPVQSKHIHTPSYIATAAAVSKNLSKISRPLSLNHTALLPLHAEGSAPPPIKYTNHQKATKKILP